MKRFYIITNEGKDPGLVFQEQIRAFLKAKGAEVLASSDGVTAPESLVPGSYDVVLVLGGDGTMLQAAGACANSRIPLLGINLGTIGYLAEVEKANFRDALTRLLADEYEIEERMMLKGYASDPDAEPDGDIAFHYALNDVAITRSGSLQVVPYTVRVNGRKLNEYHADGIIISTPTGSTGYNLSAGGPIVEPSARLLLLTPICPHTLNTRTIVFSPEDSISIEIGYGRDGQVLTAEADFDGSDHAVHIASGQTIRVSAAKRTTRIVRLSSTSFLEILHRKLS